MIEEVVHEGVLYALILRRTYHQPGVHFFTPGSFSQQLGFLSHSAGHRIASHEHRNVQREVIRTQEVLVIRQGRIRVDFYDDDRERVDHRVLDAGDVILLANGGHGFEVIENCEMVEIKQGPYMGDEDKVVFAPAGEAPRGGS